MSSPRQIPKSDGVIRRDNRCVGPISIPLEHATEFREAFNQRYASINLSIDSVPPETDSAGDIDPSE